jgi:hypothetical protein
LLPLLFTWSIFMASAASADVGASLGDASIDHNIVSDVWKISAGGAPMLLAIDPDADYALQSLVSPSGVEWVRAPDADAMVPANRRSRVLGRRSGGFVYSSASARTSGLRLELAATFVLPSENLSATRHVAGNLDAFQASIAPGPLNWLTGEQPVDEVSMQSEMTRATPSANRDTLAACVQREARLAVAACVLRRVRVARLLLDHRQRL